MVHPCLHESRSYQMKVPQNQQTAGNPIVPSRDDEKGPPNPTTFADESIIILLNGGPLHAGVNLTGRLTSAVKTEAITRGPILQRPTHALESDGAFVCRMEREDKRV